MYSPESPTYSPSSPVYSPTSRAFDPESPASDHDDSEPDRSSSISSQHITESGSTDECKIDHCNPREAIQRLHRLWVAGRPIRSHVHALLEEDGFETSLFSQSCIDAENIFGVIDQVIRSADRIRFTADVLSACRWFPEDRYHHQSPSYKWWLGFYKPVTVEELQEALEFQPIHLQKVMSSEAIDLLVTCTSFVVRRVCLRG